MRPPDTGTWRARVCVTLRPRSQISRAVLPPQPGRRVPDVHRQPQPAIEIFRLAHRSESLDNLRGKRRRAVLLHVVDDQFAPFFNLIETGILPTPVNQRVAQPHTARCRIGLHSLSEGSSGLGR